MIHKKIVAPLVAIFFTANALWQGELPCHYKVGFNEHTGHTGRHSLWKHLDYNFPEIVHIQKNVNGRPGKIICTGVLLTWKSILTSYACTTKIHPVRFKGEPKYKVSIYSRRRIKYKEETKVSQTLPSSRYMETN